MGSASTCGYTSGTDCRWIDVGAPAAADESDPAGGGAGGLLPLPSEPSEPESPEEPEDEAGGAPDAPPAPVWSSDASRRMGAQGFVGAAVE